MSVKSPRDAIARGVYLIPEDRKRTGLVLDMPIVENISLADLKRLYARHAGLGGREHQVAEEQCRALGIKAPSVETEAMHALGRQPAEGRAGEMAGHAARR